MDTGVATALTAHREWAIRPPDQRFQSLQALLEAAERQRVTASVINGLTTDLVARAEDEEVFIYDRLQKTRSLWIPTNWSFSQLCQRASAPAGYLASLSADLASQCLNEGFRKADGGEFQALTALNGGDRLRLRAVTSDRYSRVWNDALVKRMMGFEEAGFTLPLGYANGVWGAPLVPSGAYLGDRDMFLMLINEAYRLPDPTDPSGQGLARGVILRNSDVGAATLTLDYFLFRYVCGNNLIWGFKSLAHFKRRHIGAGIYEHWLDAVANVVEYLQSSPTEDLAVLTTAQTHEIGKDKDTVLAELTKSMLTKSLATKAWDSAEQQGLNPRTPWGIVNGLTRVSQVTDHQDKRYDMDLIAAQVLQMAN